MITATPAVSQAPLLQQNILFSLAINCFFRSEYFYLDSLFEKIHLQPLFSHKFLNKEKKVPVSTEDAEEALLDKS